MGRAISNLGANDVAGERGEVGGEVDFQKCAIDQVRPRICWVVQGYDFSSLEAFTSGLSKNWETLDLAQRASAHLFIC